MDRIIQSNPFKVKMTRSPLSQLISFVICRGSKSIYYLIIQLKLLNLACFVLENHTSHMLSDTFSKNKYLGNMLHYISLGRISVITL